MKKRIYQAIRVKGLDFQAISQRCKETRLTIGVDVAKSMQFASLMLEDKACMGIVKWNQLDSSENQEAMQLFARLAESASSVDLVLEPSGTYGDPLRYRAEAMGLNVYRVNPKRCRDYAEVFDGVASRHDGKSAMLLGRLHLEGFSDPWEASEESLRDMKALVKEADIHQSSLVRNLGRLEGWAARHWPELHKLMPLRRTTVLELLLAYGSPCRVAQAGAEAEQLIEKVGGHWLGRSKPAAIVKSARETMGVAMSEGERSLVRALADEILRSRAALAKVEKRLKDRGKQEPSIAAIAPTVGELTSVVLFVELGNPNRFPSAKSYLKAPGLNLKECSSGQHVGRLMLSKRGSSRARRWLYLAALRLIQNDRLTKAWYEKKLRRDGGKVRQKAVVAVMRKLVLALWHVAKGEAFDSSKLFDAGNLSNSAA